MTATGVTLLSGARLGNGLVTITFDAPLAVRLRSLSATRSARGVLVRWSTASELDTAGFHVYRELRGKRVRVTKALVPANRRSHSFLDRRAPAAGTVARYWLLEVSLDGSRSWYGPARAVSRS